MKKIPSWALVTIIVVLILAGIFLFNGMTSRSEAVKKTWTPLVSGLNQRYAAASTLAHTIAVYNGREDEVVIDLRKDIQAYNDAKDMPEKSKAANEIELDLAKISIEAKQRYSGIQTYFQFTEVLKDLEESQVNLATSLGGYNKAVEKYNSFINTFPTDILAALLGYREESYVGSSFAK